MGGLLPCIFDEHGAGRPELGDESGVLSAAGLSRGHDGAAFGRGCQGEIGFGCAGFGCRFHVCVPLRGPLGRS